MNFLGYEQELTRRRDSGCLRTLRAVEPLDNCRLRMADQTLINFSSNDYLGLSRHPLLKQRAQEWTETYGAGSTASRLVCGNLALFEQVESRIAAGKGSAAALVFNAGFQANGAILPALLDHSILGQEPLVFSDRLNHASIHHGCAAAGVRQRRFRHNDLNHLETLLKKEAHKPGARFILTETVFSMDGDVADLAGLAFLREKYGAFLYLDEAHATGVMGHNGFGLATDHPNCADLIMGTFSKALGGFGAYVACTQTMRDYLINRCGGFIYSTALPPAVLGSMDAALELLPSLTQQRQQLQHQAARVRARLTQSGLNTGASASQIIPVMIGDTHRTLEAAAQLEQKGFLVVAVRPPTVPSGSSRLRLSLSAAHQHTDIDDVVSALCEFGDVS
ncbi:MAG: 8-amino-7-oxononanoate synthase [Magnetococcales bacterium]|nr:8-amino-7-oxononanoate synthase [Magnetococcales bacterium]